MDSTNPAAANACCEAFQVGVAVGAWLGEKVNVAFAVPPAVSSLVVVVMVVPLLPLLLLLLLLLLALALLLVTSLPFLLLL